MQQSGGGPSVSFDASVFSSHASELAGPIQEAVSNFQQTTSQLGGISLPSAFSSSEGPLNSLLQQLNQIGPFFAASLEGIQTSLDATGQDYAASEKRRAQLSGGIVAELGEEK